MKLVSICIPVYNEISRIQACLDVLKQQTYPAIEICISDNQSNDGTFEYLTQRALADDRIRLERQPRNVGASGNFDAVRRMARGEYFMWLGADDRIEPTYIEKLVASLEQNPQLCCIQSATITVDDWGQVARRIRYHGAIDPNRHGPLRQAMNLLSVRKNLRSRKMNYFVYGLYRREIVERIVDKIGNPLNYGDSVLPALAALSGGLAYVDEFLFVRHIHQKAYRDRAGSDPQQQERLRQNRPSNILRWIWQCPTIPLRRKWIAFVIAAPLALRAAALAATRLLPRALRGRLKDKMARAGWKPWSTTTGKF